MNLWASCFLSSGTTTLAEFLPFTSKDLDFVGSVDQLEALHRRFSGTKKMGPPRSPVVGRLELPFRDGVRIVELLHIVKGLSFEDLKRHVDITVGGMSARVLLPRLVLKAKTENSATIDQEGRNDVKHVLMMIRCNRAFIAELLGFAKEEKVTQRQVVNVPGEVRTIVLSPMAVRATALWDFDFTAVWPWRSWRVVAWRGSRGSPSCVWTHDDDCFECSGLRGT